MKSQKIFQIINNELVFPDGLSFLEVLEKLNNKNCVEIETRLLALIESKQETFDKLVKLTCTELAEYKLDNILKLGAVSRALFNIYKIGAKYGK